MLRKVPAVRQKFRDTVPAERQVQQRSFPEEMENIWFPLLRLLRWRSRSLYCMW
ncbi:hypothetical protein EVA_20798 [gut metagenome]|uniref:Uncharacterized protein n=1 Tax=gut metagenome TaxID=749906 RepID=J9BU78_9ZZZZ